MTYVYMLIELIQEYISKIEAFFQPFFDMVKSWFNPFLEMLSPFIEVCQTYISMAFQVCYVAIGIAGIILLIIVVIVALGSDEDTSKSSQTVQYDPSIDLAMYLVTIDTIKKIENGEKTKKNNDRNYFTN